MHCKHIIPSKLGLGDRTLGASGEWAWTNVLQEGDKESADVTTALPEGDNHRDAGQEGVPPGGGKDSKNSRLFNSIQLQPDKQIGGTGGLVVQLKTPLVQPIAAHAMAIGTITVWRLIQQ